MNQNTEIPKQEIRIKCKGSKTMDYRELQEFQGSLKTMTKMNATKLKNEILDLGWTSPIFVWNKKIMDGHGRLFVLKQMEQDGISIPELPVVEIFADDEHEAGRMLLGINSKFQQITPDGLLDFMAKYDIKVPELDNIELPDINLDVIADALLGDKEGLIDDDEIPGVPESITRPGDLWILGNHRLLCGDSTDKNNVNLLMDGQKADLIYTDPPYGVSYTGENWDMIENDELRGNELFELLYKSFQNAYRVSKNNPAVYVWHPSSNQTLFETALNKAGFEVKQQLIWNKGITFGRSDYHWAHELCFYARKKIENSEWHGDRKQLTILRDNKTDLSKLKKEELLEIMMALQDEKTTWEIKRDSFKEYVHPTQKPVDLIARGISNNTKPGMRVLDLFTGSGSTIIGSEKLNRICYAMELDSHYCDIIMNRWQKYTGEKANLVRK